MGTADEIFERIRDKQPMGEEPAYPVVRYGPDFIVLLGAHTDDGMCWCLPTATDRACPVPGHRHYVYDHRDRIH